MAACPGQCTPTYARWHCGGSAITRHLPSWRPCAPCLYLRHPRVEAEPKFASFPRQVAATSVLYSVHRDAAPLRLRLLPHRADRRCCLRVSSSPRRCAVLEPSEQLALRHGAIPAGSPLGEAGTDRSSTVKTSPRAATSSYGRPQCCHLEHLDDATLLPGTSNGFPDHRLKLTPSFVTVSEGLTITRRLW
jgi:hypothetical protein